MPQVHAPVRRTYTSRAEEMEVLAADDTPTADDSAEAILDATDELLDEIDAVLEEQSVLTNYRQRGGQ